ncbi:MAG: hypothetical protein E7582_07130 [Ruminococcaceae bacterium]|nr:hypothetical protein [Oscillospiraceae bacterium]
MTDVAKEFLKTHPHKIELHCHTAKVSPCSDIGVNDMARIYASEGYSGLVLTNHFYPWHPKNKKAYDKYVEEYIEEYKRFCEIGEDVGLKVYLGMEIRFPENANDYLVYGIDPDFVRNKISPDMKTLEDFVKVAKSDDNLIIQAHPFRNGMVLANESLIDGIEVYNVHPNHNSRVGFAAKYAEELNFVCTCGSDTHHYGQGALSALITRELPKDSKDLVKYLVNEPIYKIGNSIITF